MPAAMLGLTVILPAAWPMFAGDADQATLELGRAVALVTMIGFTVMSLVVAWRELLPLAVHGGGLEARPEGLALRLIGRPMLIPWRDVRGAAVESRGSGRGVYEVLAIRFSGTGYRWPRAISLWFSTPTCLCIYPSLMQRPAAVIATEVEAARERFTTHGQKAVRASIAEHAVAVYTEPLAYGTKRHPGKIWVAGLLLWSVFSVLLAFLAVNEGDVAAFLRVSVLGLATFAVAVAIWFKGEAWFGDD